MEFTLCYKTYEFTPTLGAALKFEEMTGKCFQSTCVAYYSCYETHKGKNLSEIVCLLGEIITMKEASAFFYCLAKENNSALPKAEIDDAVYHAGAIGSLDDEKLLPWPLVMTNVCVTCITHVRELAKGKKPKAD